jgi:GAF domain-containing protein
VDAHARSVTACVRCRLAYWIWSRSRLIVAARAGAGGDGWHLCEWRAIARGWRAPLSGEELQALAEEQAALRRVATLVARGAPPEEVFAAVTEEAGRLLSVEYATLGRYEPDATMTTVVAWTGAADFVPPVGRRQILWGTNISTLVFQTGRPARIDDYAGASGPVGVAAREDGVGSGVGSPVIVEGCLWGVLAIYSTVGQPLPADTEARLASFTELVATAIANAESRAGLGRLAEEQAALRRVATLVARGTPPPEVFAAVTQEVIRLLQVDFALMGRYESDGALTTVGASGRTDDLRFPLGRPMAAGGRNLGTIIAQTGRSARMDSYADASGSSGVAARESGIRSAVGTPIIVEGRLWGVLAAGSMLEDPLPGDAESRLANFTELLATAIANAESRAGLARLADEQAALRRVATLVARGAPPEELFAAVAEEVGQLLSVASASMGRYEPDGTVTSVAAWGSAVAVFPVGSCWIPEGKNLTTIVFETGRPARIDNYADASGSLGVAARETGFRSAVATPVIVEGRLWGVVVAGSSGEQPLRADTEERLAQFTELVATAIANTESRAALASSRARIVAAADDARRQIERDLHDGIQQRLVSLGLELRMAQAMVPPQFGEVEGMVERVGSGLMSVFDELREISHGIHPAILSEGGLQPALSALCRRSAVPVELDLHAKQRLPERVEVAAYYVVSEALTNAAKHAYASGVKVELDTPDAILRLAIRDDGIGGADPGQGSGLVGLSDRIEALGGALEITSPVGKGTTLLVEVPLEGQSSAVSLEP